MRRSIKIGAPLFGTVLVVCGARADTAIGGYSSAGSALNPQGLFLNLPRDPGGLSMLDSVTRTPTGLLYPLPFQLPDMTQSSSDPDWWSMGWIETGILGSAGRTRSALFRQYADWNDGPLVTSLGFQAENRKTALYIQMLAENVGRSDGFAQVKIGRYGVFDVTAFYDSIPHVFSTQAHSIWNGVGSGDLTLRGGLTPGGATPAQVTSVATSVAPAELRVTREKAGAALHYTPSKEIEGVVQISNEWRNGTQPISATFGYPFENGATQIVQPVRYRTIDVTAALRYKDDGLQANLTYTGSFFRNEIAALVWQNPGLSTLAGTGAYTPMLGRLSLPPDNTYHSLKGDLTTLLSPELRFSASLSYSLMRQSEPLLPPTIDSGLISGLSTSINLDQWNTTDALSRLRANAGIDLFNAFAQLLYTVSPDFSVTLSLRDRSERNLTNYVAYNPLTGQYGYIAIDGGLAPFSPRLSGVYEPGAPGSLVQIRNMPFANDSLELSAVASYRVDNHLKLDSSYVRNSVHHSVREVRDANDNRARLQLVTNGYSWGTVRVSYEFASLSGSPYVSNPYLPYYSASLPGYTPKTPAGDPPWALSDLRKFDVANRTEHVAKLQTNYILSPRTDLQFGGDLKFDNYDANYGLRATRSLDLNAALNYQMSLTATLTGFFTFQDQGRGVANINATGQGTDGGAGSAGYPLANSWYEAGNSEDYAAGFTAHQSWDNLTVDVSYTFTHDVSSLRYNYASTGAFFGLLTQAQAGSSFPDTTYDAHLVEANALWQFRPNITWRFYYRFDYQHVDDFHYVGLASVISNNTYLGVTPESTAAHTVGVFLQYRL